MIYANVNDTRQRALPNTIGSCPLCESKVISKCGEIKQWHWAHENLSECDSFSEGETDWHIFMKNQFSTQFQEQVIVKNGIKHRADVCVYGKVIEYQHSSISSSEIKSREEFYETMVWCLDVTNHNGRFKMKAKVNDTGRAYHTFHWSHFKKSFCEAKKPIYLHLGDLYFHIKRLYDNGSGWGYPLFSMPFVEHPEALAGNKINPGVIASPNYYVKVYHVEQNEEFVLFTILANELVGDTKALTIKIKKGYGKEHGMKYIPGSGVLYGKEHGMKYIPGSGVLDIPRNIFVMLQNNYNKDTITLK